jgi:hypothetical protein
MFGKRHDDTELERAERREAEEHRDRGEYVRQLTRAVMTLLGAAAAGLLIWLATQVGDDSTGGYWTEYGLFAAAGLALALSQLLGGWTKWGWPKVSAAVFLLGFLPVLIVGGWLLLAHQPEGASFRDTALNWSGDVGAGGLVDDLREYLPVVAFGIGLVFGFTFDTRGPRVHTETVGERRDVAAVPHERAAADEPVTAETHTVPAATSDVEGEPVGTQRRARVFDAREGVVRDEPAETTHRTDR